MTRRNILKAMMALGAYTVIPMGLLAERDDTKLFKRIVKEQIPIENKTFYFNHPMELDYAKNFKMHNCKLVFNIKEKYKTLFTIHKYKNLDIRNTKFILS